MDRLVVAVFTPDTNNTTIGKIATGRKGGNIRSRAATEKKQGEKQNR
jgi:hypothetical protein